MPRHPHEPRRAGALRLLFFGGGREPGEPDEEIRIEKFAVATPRRSFTREPTIRK